MPRGGKADVESIYQRSLSGQKDVVKLCPLNDVREIDKRRILEI